MEGRDLRLTSVLVRCLLGPLGLSGSIADTSWTQSYPKQSCLNARLQLPTHPFMYAGENTKLHRS